MCVKWSFNDRYIMDLLLTVTSDRYETYEVDPTMGDLRVGFAAWPLWSAAAVPRVRNLTGQW